MKEMRKLGDFVQPVDVRNTDLSVTRLLGLSINKCFIESIANTIGTDFRPYKIVKKGQFAYGPVTSRNGEKITIALLEEPECIISSSYAVFEITDTSKLLPEYLMLWFSRPEFDRYARYKSHGSVREIFDWDEMCRVELPVPPLNEQQKIVDTYNAITNRIRIKQKINENLEKTAQAIYRKNTKEFIGDKITVTVEDYCNIFTGKKDVNQALESGKYKFFSCSPIYLYSNDFIYDGKAVLVAGNGSYTGRTTFVDEAFDLYQRTYAITPKNKFDKMIYMICMSFKTDFQKNMEQKLHGSAIPYIVYDNLAKHSFDLNSKWENDAEIIEKILKDIKENELELIKLNQLKQLVVSQISQS